MGSDGLSLSVTHADGRVTSWGPDEPNATEIPADLTFGSSIPGGFKDLTCSLLRRIDVDYADQALFDSVRVYGPGNRTVWEGRLAQFPRSHGDGFSITPGAVGWASHLKDDPSFRAVYVDRDVASWHEASLVRKLAIATGGITQGKILVSLGFGGIVWLPPVEALISNERTEVMYDIGAGLEVARVEYRGARTGAFTNFEAPTVFTSTTEDFASSSSEALTFDNTRRVATAFTDGRYAMLRARASSATTPAAGYSQTVDQLAVYGSHGITLTASAGEFSGFLASDVLPHILATAAPEITAGNLIEATAFVIPHLAFRDPVTAEDAIMFLNAYHQYEWGVYDNREFFYRAPDPSRLTWEARLSDGAHLDLEGDTAEQIFNGVMVTYTDPIGQKMTVGPTGGLFDNTDSALEDTSATNPVNAHGIARRWAKLDISFPTTLAGATQLGYVWLQEHSLPQRRGTLTLNGMVTHPTEGEVPVWRVRAGDFVSISDHANDVPRRIIEQRYSGVSNTLTLDNTSAKLDAIMERIGVQLVGVF